MKQDEIKKVFFSDIQDKKRTGSGVYRRKGKGVKHKASGIWFPSDFLTEKELKELNGKVIVYNMYEKILSKDEFDKLDKETQRNMLTFWRKNYTNKEIMEQMGVASATLYKYIDALGLPKNQLKSRKKEQMQNELDYMHNIPAPFPQEPAVQPVRLIRKGLYLEYNGVYSGSQISNIFEKLQLLLDDEEKKFNIMIAVEEIVD